MIRFPYETIESGLDIDSRAILIKWELDREDVVFLLVETEELFNSEAGGILACVLWNYKQEILPPEEVRRGADLRPNLFFQSTPVKTPIAFG